MVVKSSDMVRDVRVAVDMNRLDPSLRLEGEAETLSFDELALSKLCDAVRRVELSAPAWMLEGRSFSGCPVCMEPGGSGWLLLPDDFMRLVSFRMSDWSRPVSSALLEGDAGYSLSFSGRAGIAGSPEKPTVTITNMSEGLCLRFASCRDAAARVAQALYVPCPRFDSLGGIEVSGKCYRAAVYMAASLTLRSLGDARAGDMEETSKGMLE